MNSIQTRHELPFGYYESLDTLSAKMLDAARQAQWNEVATLEQECCDMMERLRATNAPAGMDQAQRKERLKILKRIVERDGEIRKLAHPWTGRIETWLGHPGKSMHLPENDESLLSPFRVTNTREIHAQLRGILNQKTLVSVFSETDNEVYVVTQLTEIDTASGRVAFELLPEDKHAQMILQQGTATLVTFVEQIKVQFPLVNLQMAQHEGAEGLTAQIPDSLVRIQRREAYRVRPLLSEPASCQVLVPGAKGARTDLNVLDVSVGGLSFEAPESFAQITLLNEMSGCFLYLPGHSAFRCDLIVRYAGKSSGDKKMRRIGVEFRQLNGTDERTIQMYVNSVDTRRRSVKLN